jgi:acyl-CoA synthetase (AMP-forming)/AMP-acid ligase II/aryl carrier-like protein
MTEARDDVKSIAALLQDQAKKRPERAALCAPGRRPLTYAALWREVEQLRRAFSADGLTARSRVAVSLSNGPEAACATIATASNAACVPINPVYRVSEVTDILVRSSVQAVVISHDDNGPIREVAGALSLRIVEITPQPAAPAGSLGIVLPRSARDSDVTFDRSPEDIALVMHTSGSTGTPKTVPLTHANATLAAKHIARSIDLTEDDCCINVLPLFHTHGLIGAVLSSLLAGARVVCHSAFDPEAFFGSARDFNATWYTAVPTVHQAIVASEALYRSLAPGHRFRVVRSTSSALAPQLCAELEALSQAPVVEAYGMTEAMQIASNPLHGLRKPGSVGPRAAAEIAVVDSAGNVQPAGVSGEIVVRGPTVMSAYEVNPEGNAQSFVNGWFRTADQGRIDPDGYVFITGRLKEIINRGGEKIAPREVDEALLAHPAVSEAVAFAVPHPTLGEDVAAAVVLRQDCACDESALRAFVLERLASYKVPAMISIVADIPKEATGKVNRASLSARLAPQLRREHFTPCTSVERSTAAMFRELLGCPEVGLRDNFFALGGDSLVAIRLLARVNARHGIELGIPQLFANPTVETFASAIETEIASLETMHRELVTRIAQMTDEEVNRLLAEQEQQATRSMH